VDVVEEGLGKKRYRRQQKRSLITVRPPDGYAILSALKKLVYAASIGTGRQLKAFRQAHK
jgi:hypothetical protein